MTLAERNAERNRTPKMRRIASLTAKRMWRDPEFRLRIAAARKSSPKWLSAVRKTVKKAQEVARYSPIRIAAAKENIKKAANSPKRKKASRKTIVYARKFIRRPSKPQSFMFRFLLLRGIKGLKMEYPVNVYRADIAIPKRKVAIEVDGSYWHKKNSTDYVKRDQIFQKLGWKVLRISVPFRWFDYGRAYKFCQ